MTSRPILFSGAMVRAILSGRKTETRRVLRLPAWAPSSTAALLSTQQPVTGLAYIRGGLAVRRYNCPYGAPGESRLWVRETWAEIPRRPIPASECWWGSDRAWPGAEDYPPHPSGRADLAVAFAATWDDRYPMRGHWRPSIHMPRWASRLTLEVLDVRVERLQQIDQAGALAEGVGELDAYQEAHELACVTGLGTGEIARDVYADLWDEINGERADGASAWDRDPWVWVVRFRRVTP